MKNYVNGTVIGFDDQEVTCYLQLSDRSIEVTIPRKHFSFDIFVGKCFTLSVNKIDGEVLPVIVERTPDPEKVKEGLAELDKIISEILEENGEYT